MAAVFRVISGVHWNGMVEDISPHCYAKWFQPFEASEEVKIQFTSKNNTNTTGHQQQANSIAQNEGSISRMYFLLINISKYIFQFNRYELNYE